VDLVHLAYLLGQRHPPEQVGDAFFRIAGSRATFRIDRSHGEYQRTAAEQSDTPRPVALSLVPGAVHQPVPRGRRERLSLVSFSE